MIGHTDPLDGLPGLFLLRHGGLQDLPSHLFLLLGLRRLFSQLLGTFIVLGLMVNCLRLLMSADLLSRLGHGPFSLPRFAR